MILKILSFVDVYDPIAQRNDLKNNYGISLLSNEILLNLNLMMLYFGCAT